MKTARLYQCALCSAQVIICSNCDRGNIYCGVYCAKQARLENHRKSNRLYQKSFIGKINNAHRQSRFRERQNKKVTDQGSLAKPRSDLLSDISRIPSFSALNNP